MLCYQGLASDLTDLLYQASHAVRAVCHVLRPFYVPDRCSVSRHLGLLIIQNTAVMHSTQGALVVNFGICNPAADIPAKRTVVRHFLCPKQ